MQNVIDLLGEEFIDAIESLMVNITMVRLAMNGVSTPESRNEYQKRIEEAKEDLKNILEKCQQN